MTVSPQKRVRLCIVNTLYVKDLKTFPGVVFDEARKFSKYLEEVHVILFHKSRKSFALRENVFVHTVEVKLHSHLLSSTFSIFISYLLLIILITQIIRRYKVNVVRADDIIRTGVPTIVACHLMRVPKVIYVAGSMEEILKYKYHGNRVMLKVSKFLERFVMYFSDHVFALTYQLVSRARIYGAKSVSWSPTRFLEPEKFIPKDQSSTYPKLRVLYAGRLERGKGVEVLIEAAKLLREEDIEFRIVGDGLLRGQLEQRVKTLGLNSTVRFLGLIPHSKMPEIHNDADVFALPSFTEGAPVAVLEAASCGKPVIVTPVGIIPEIFMNGIHVLIVPPGDSQALAEAIRIMKENPKMRERLASSARAVVLERFNSYIQQHIEAYHRIVAHSPKTEAGNHYKIDVGCGDNKRPGFLGADVWRTQDVDVISDVEKLPFKDSSFDAVYSSHCIEHFSHRTTRAILREWIRVLKEGHEIEIRCPNLRLRALLFFLNPSRRNMIHIYGNQLGNWGYHKAGFSFGLLKSILHQEGVIDVRRVRDWKGKYSFFGLHLVGIKRQPFEKSLSRQE